MKLVIQIPCYNEEATLGITLAALPRSVPGFDRVEWLVIDDGSVDHTSRVALEHGVDHIVRFPQNRGLAKAFTAGLHKALEVGADVVVNTDADNQYDASCIPDLVAPILKGQADMVIGTRPIATIAHFSPLKKLLQKLGSLVVRVVSNTRVEDCPSGFRAFSREMAMQVHVFGSYTYTIETIIQAGQNRYSIACIPIRVNADLRPSRLVRSIPRYIYRTGTSMLRVFVTYSPLRFFFSLGALSFAAGLAICARFLYYLWVNGGGGHIQSLILAAVLLLMGLLLFVTGLVADLIAVNRKLLEKIDLQIQAQAAKARSDEPYSRAS